MHDRRGRSGPSAPQTRGLKGDSRSQKVQSWSARVLVSERRHAGGGATLQLGQDQRGDNPAPTFRSTALPRALNSDGCVPSEFLLLWLAILGVGKELDFEDSHAQSRSPEHRSALGAISSTNCLFLALEPLSTEPDDRTSGHLWDISSC